MTFNEINNQVNFSESLCPFTNSGILYSPEEDINEREQNNVPGGTLRVSCQCPGGTDWKIDQLYSTLAV
ncbi:hypothetical protein ACLB1M_13125 [Escherichia coli]